MIGWHQQIGGEYEKVTGVIGIVCAPKFPDHDIIREKIREGVERRPGDVWVIREKPQANHAVNVVWETLEELGIEPFHVPLVAAWASKGTPLAYDAVTRKPSITAGAYDLRRKWADAELGTTCERIIVFHDKSSNVTADWGDPTTPRTARVFVIERGKKKSVKRRTGRKPTGV
jgi:hypothetical protein